MRFKSLRKQLSGKKLQTLCLDKECVEIDTGGNFWKK